MIYVCSFEGSRFPMNNKIHFFFRTVSTKCAVLYKFCLTPSFNKSTFVPSGLGNPCLRMCVVFAGDQHLNSWEDQLLIFACGRQFLSMVGDVDREEWIYPNRNITR